MKVRPYTSPEMKPPPLRINIDAINKKKRNDYYTDISKSNTASKRPSTCPTQKITSILKNEVDLDTISENSSNVLTDNNNNNNNNEEEENEGNVENEENTTICDDRTTPTPTDTELPLINPTGDEDEDEVSTPVIEENVMADSEKEQKEKEQKEEEEKEEDRYVEMTEEQKKEYKRLKKKFGGI